MPGRDPKAVSVARLLAPSFSGVAAGTSRSVWFRADLLAGLTVWAVLVPESLAYAAIAGVSPVVGLYAALPALVLYPLFGARGTSSSARCRRPPRSRSASCRHLPAARDFVALTAALALAIGVAALLAGLMRLGFLAAFISEPVLKGFIIGLALTIIIGQVPALFGVEKGDGNFFEKLWHLLTAPRRRQRLTLAVGLASWSSSSCSAVRSRWSRVAGRRALGIVAVALFDLDDHGVEIVGHIDRGLPSSGCPESALGSYLLLGRRPSASCWSGSPRASAPPRRTPPRPATTSMPTRSSRAGRREPRRRARRRHGGQRQPVEDRGQRRRGGQVARCPALTAAALTIVTLLFLTGLFEKLPEADPRGRRDRGGG